MVSILTVREKGGLFYLYLHEDFLASKPGLIHQRQWYKGRFSGARGRLQNHFVPVSQTELQFGDDVFDGQIKGDHRLMAYLVNFGKW